MSRAIITFGVGAHAELLDISVPSFRAYANRHGYDLRVIEASGPDRPASWWKVPLLRDTLGEYDEVLWLDADVIVVDDGEDIADHVPADRWQGLAVHLSAADGLHPNCGVWFVRQPMITVLEHLWGKTEYVDHPWWEQAAMHELLGYAVGSRPVRMLEPTALMRATALLSSEWNYTPGCANTPTGRFMHAAGGRPPAARASLMREWANARLAA